MTSSKSYLHQQQLHSLAHGRSGHPNRLLPAIRTMLYFKPTCRRNLATAFRTHIINSPKETEHVSTSSPVRVLGSCSFMYMRHNDVYILAVTKSNANVMLSFQFMTQVRSHSLVEASRTTVHHDYHRFINTFAAVRCR